MQGEGRRHLLPMCGVPLTRIFLGHIDALVYTKGDVALAGACGRLRADAIESRRF